MTGALSKRCAHYERKFWLLNPSSRNPLCQSTARSHRFPWWSAPTRWISRNLREKYPRQRCSKPSGMTVRILKPLRRTAQIWKKYSRLWQSEVDFQPKRARLNIARSLCALTRRCGRAGRRGGGSRSSIEMFPAAHCTHWPDGRVSPLISVK